LIDPPFEAADEFARATKAIEKAWRKWATGIIMFWYPVKDAGFVPPLRRTSRVKASNAFCASSCRPGHPRR